MADIRKAQPGEENAIGALLVKLVGQHVEYDKDRFSDFVTAEGASWFYRSRMDAAEAEVIVATDENEIVGFAYLEFEKQNYAVLAENSVWLHDLYVERGARSAGVGKALMNYSAQLAREMNGSQLILNVAAKNALAQGFFEGLGYRPTMIEMTLSLDQK